MRSRAGPRSNSPSLTIPSILMLYNIFFEANDLFHLMYVRSSCDMMVTLSKRVVLFGILVAATLLISTLSLYLKGVEYYGSIDGHHSRVRFVETSTSEVDADRGSQRTPDCDQRKHSLSSQKNKGYLLVLYVLEQLTMSSSHYISLLNLAHSWGLSGVEPTVCRSRMYGLPGISGICHHQYRASSPHSQVQKNSVEIKYSQLYNLSYLNNELRRCLHAKSKQFGNLANQTLHCQSSVIDPLHTFLQTSHRNVVLVHFVHGIGGSTSRMTFLSQEVTHRFEQNVTFPLGEPIVDCTQVAKDSGVVGVIEGILNKKATKSMSMFTVQRVVCISTEKAKGGIDVTHLKNVIFDSVPNVSVVFTKWQNHGVISEGSEILSRCKVSPIPHSQEVISASKRFLSSTKFNVREPFVAVHLRLERFYQCEALIPGYTKCCLERLSSVLSQVLSKHGINKKDVLIIKDYGLYGTDSCSYKLKYVNISICLNLTDEFFRNLQQYGYSPTEFIPGNYGSDLPDNSGFVSLVESRALLSGNVLVVGGFGSYQGTIIKQFLDISNPKIGVKHFNSKRTSAMYNRVYRVCTCKSFKGHDEKLNGIELGMHSCEGS